jgi:hypothetical protein
MEALENNARTSITYQEQLQTLMDKTVLPLKHKSNLKNYRFAQWLPGKRMSVGSDNLSSPTTESERTGVYLKKKRIKLAHLGV